MVELQFDAGGRRCVVTVPANRPSVSDDAALVVGEEWTSKIEVPVEPLTSYLVNSTKPVTVHFGETPIEVSPGSPRLWFEAWASPCEIKESEKPQSITATATEPGTQLSIVLVT